MSEHEHSTPNEVTFVLVAWLSHSYQTTLTFTFFLITGTQASIGCCREFWTSGTAIKETRGTGRVAL